MRHHRLFLVSVASLFLFFAYAIDKAEAQTTYNDGAVPANFAVTDVKTAPGASNGTQDEKTCQQWCTPFLKTLPPSEYAFFVAEAADMLTTLDIKYHPNLIEENPILGNHPSDGKIIGWCFIAAGAHAAITYSLIDGGAPDWLVKTWTWGGTFVEAGFAIHNYSLGLRFRM